MNNQQQAINGQGKKILEELGLTPPEAPEASKTSSGGGLPEVVLRTLNNLEAFFHIVSEFSGEIPKKAKQDIAFALEAINLLKTKVDLYESPVYQSLVLLLLILRKSPIASRKLSEKLLEILIHMV